MQLTVDEFALPLEEIKTAQFFQALGDFRLIRFDGVSWRCAVFYKVSIAAFNRHESSNRTSKSKRFTIYSKKIKKMSNHRAETFTSSDELKGIVKAYLANCAVDEKRCLTVDTSYVLSTSDYVVLISYCYEQTDSTSKMSEPLAFWVEKTTTVHDIKEQVQKAAQEIEDAEYNDLTSKDY
jgi:hypothetical protein